MRLCLSIAKRFLLSNKMQTFIIVLGIGIGISVQIFIGSLIQGLQKGLVEKTIGSSSHITIKPEKDESGISDYTSIISEVKSYDNRIKYISPVLDSPALLEVSSKSQSLLIRGFDLEKADDIYKLSSSLTEGNLPQNNNEIILGKSLKDEYNLKTGDIIQIVTQDKSTENLKVSGFFDLKVASINNSWGITSLESAQGLFKKSNIVSSVEIQVDRDSVFEADVVSDKITNKLNGNFTVENWKIANEQLLSGLNGQSVSSLMIQIFVVISVVLGIASVLAITVMQKSRQIGILKAMGISNARSSLIFLFEGLIFGVLGAVAGVLLGLGLAYSFTTFAVNPDGTPVVDLFIDAKFIAFSGMIAVISCVLASLVPARRSSKLNPIDIIRNN